MLNNCTACFPPAQLRLAGRQHFPWAPRARPVRSLGSDEGTWTRRIDAPEKVAERFTGTRYADGLPVPDDRPAEQREAA